MKIDSMDSYFPTIDVDELDEFSSQKSKSNQNLNVD